MTSPCDADDAAHDVDDVSERSQLPSSHGRPTDVLQPHLDLFGQPVDNTLGVVFVI